MLPQAFVASAVAFHASAKLCAVTGSPLWNVRPGLILIVQTFWSVDVTDSASCGTGLPFGSSVISVSKSALSTLRPYASFVLPGIRCSGSMFATVKVFDLLSDPPPLPPQADAAIAIATAPASNALTFINPPYAAWVGATLVKTHRRR